MEADVLSARLSEILKETLLFNPWTSQIMVSGHLKLLTDAITDFLLFSFNLIQDNGFTG